MVTFGEVDALGFQGLDAGVASMPRVTSTLMLVVGIKKHGPRFMPYGDPLIAQMRPTKASSQGPHPVGQG